MNKAIIGKKLGMTQIFLKDGVVVPVTVIEAGPCVVTQVKSLEKDGYKAVQVGFGKTKQSKVNKPQMGLFKKINTEPKYVLKEFRYDDISDFEVGKEIRCDIFGENEMVDVSGITKGHGFTGVIKRWNQHRLKMTHGTGPVHRQVGSMGARSTPGRVFKNKKMPGQYGVENASVQNLKVVRIDKERNLLLIKGSVPGAKNSYVVVKTAVKK